MPDLDISKCDADQKKEILKYAAEVRKFEIERFWQRSGFFGCLLAQPSLRTRLYIGRETALSPYLWRFSL
jgi:hypothetical protein